MVPESLLQTSTCYRTSNQHRHLTFFATTTIEHTNLAVTGSAMPCPSNAALLRASPERPALHQPPTQASPCHHQPPSLSSVDLLVAVLLCILDAGASGSSGEAPLCICSSSVRTTLPADQKSRLATAALHFLLPDVWLLLCNQNSRLATATS